MVRWTWGTDLFPSAFQHYGVGKWAIYQQVFGNCVTLPSFPSPICSKRQLEEQKPSPPSCFICSVYLRCHGTTLVPAFHLRLGLLQLIVVCACNHMSISGKNCWSDNTHSLGSDKSQNSLSTSCIFSHQGGQWGQVHADGDHATGETELAELSLSLGQEHAEVEPTT